jgi:bifunctional non-homologous end joining protein LigD
MQPVTTIGLDICQVGCQWSSRVRTRRQKMGWLYLGRHKGRGLMYAGKVDHGFDTASAKDLRARLRPLIRKTRPYSKKITHRGIWVEPLPLAEIEYRVKSAEGKVRHPFFKGVREDL